MKIEHRRQSTEVGRTHLAQTLVSLQAATALLEEAARVGNKSTLLRGRTVG